MFFRDGKAWGRSRRIIAPNLNGHNVAAMLPITSKVAVLNQSWLIRVYAFEDVPFRVCEGVWPLLSSLAAFAPEIYQHKGLAVAPVSHGVCNLP